MTHFRLIEQGIDVSALLDEIGKNERLWLRDTSRQDNVRCQRETQTIFLCSPKKPFPQGASNKDVRETARTKSSFELPRLYEWAEAFCSRVGGEIGRVMLVRLKPGGRIYAHRDQGSYYESRERYHFLLQAKTPSLMICGGEHAEMRAGEVWWFDNQQEYEERNDSDDWRLHVIVDMLPTPPRPRSGSAFKHFQLLKSNVDISAMLRELDSQPEMWLVDSSRQDNIRVQRETSNIPLRVSVKPHPAGIEARDVHPSERSKIADQFPVIYGWVERFAREAAGELARLTIVRLNPHAQVLRHIDEGEYYKARDRYHLVLRSPGGSEMLIGDERVVFKDGELWWFDNKAPHEAYNPSDEGRVHVIFDVRPLRKDEVAQPEKDPGPPTAGAPAADLGSQVDDSGHDVTALIPESLRTRLQAHDGPVYLACRRGGKLLQAQWLSPGDRLEAIATATRGSNEPGGQVADTLELCLASGFRVIDPHTDGEWNSDILRGVRGLELTIKDSPSSRELVSPTTMIATNRDADKVIADFCCRHGLVEDALEIGALQVRTFDADQFLVALGEQALGEPAHGEPARAIPLLRGKRYVPLDLVNRDLVARLERLLGDYLIRSVQPDGRLRYLYYPSRGTEEKNRNNQVRQWMATLALCRLAKYRGDDSIFDVALRNIRYNLEHFYSEEGALGLIDDQGKVKLGAVALAVLALGAHNRRAEFASQEARLWTTIERLWCDNGAFRTFYRPADQDDQHNFYPGEALLAWSSRCQERKEKELAARIQKSFEYYRAWHRANRNPAFIPWHTQAYVQMWWLTQAPELRDFVFEMNDWLLDVQQWDDAPHDDCRGRFYDPRRPFGPPHASSDGVYLEGLIDAFRLALVVKDKRRMETYRTALVRGLHSIAQLTFKDDVDMYYTQKRDLLRGGVRTTVYDNVVRVDNVQHCLMAILKILATFPDPNLSSPTV